MDPSGKLIFTRNQQVLSGNVQMIQQDDTSPASDGARLPISLKEIGSSEIFATSLIHSPNGRFVTVVGDGEYITYTALAWRNKSFGNGISFAWAPDSNTYAVLENRVKLRIFKNFRERGGAGMKGVGSWSMDGIHGGTLLAARGPGFVMFWDWESGEIVRRIDVEAQNIYWSGTGSLVAITAAESFYILRFDRDAYNAKIEEGAEISDEGVEEAFEVVADVQEGSVFPASEYTFANTVHAEFEQQNGLATVSYIQLLPSDCVTSWAVSRILSVHLTRKYEVVFLARSEIVLLGLCISSAIYPPTTASTSPTRMSTSMATLYRSVS